MSLTSSRTHCLSPARQRLVESVPTHVSGYARMFPDLPPLDVDEHFLRALGRAGGPCDCGDVDDAPDSLGDTAAGWPIFGQFIAHDITADRSALQSHADPARLRNARTPRLDLDCLYGDGPVGQPFLYQRDDSAKFLLGTGGSDVPRNVEGTALLGDPRNDSHMLMAQMHLAMLKVHNSLADAVRGEGVANHQAFDSARRELRWHYQWIVLHEFLPALIGPDLLREVLDKGPQWRLPTGEAFIPLEFADAAYRYGHCQIRHRYQLNRNTKAVPVFPDLLGFRPMPGDRTIDWTLFFDTDGSPAAQRAKKIDGRLVRALIELPVAVTGECDVAEYHSLAVRDLQRGQGVGLPSGEAIARFLGVEPLTADEVGLSQGGWKKETPLWYYVLREADVKAGGNRLGPVGGRIVADVLVAIVDHDTESVLHADPAWRPRGSLSQLLTRGAG